MIGTGVVVSKVEVQALELVGLASSGTGKIVHDLGGHDLGDAKSSAELLLGVVDDSAHLVLEQEAVGQHVLGHEHDRVAGALVILARLDGSTDEGASVRVVLSLLVALGRTDEGGLDSEEVIIGPDGTDVELVDLVVVGSETAVTEEHRASDLLVEHHAHLGLDPSDDVEIGDVLDVITVELLLLVDGRRGGDALEQAEDLFLLQLTLDVTASTSLVLGDVGEDGLHARERSVVDTVARCGFP